MAGSAAILREAPEPVKARLAPWQFSLLILASVSFVETFMTWTWGNGLSLLNYNLRHWSLVVFTAELAVFAVLTLRLQGQLAGPTLNRKMVWLLSATLIFATISTLANVPTLGTSYLAIVRYALHFAVAWQLFRALSLGDGIDVQTWLAWISWGALAYTGALTLFVLTVRDPANFNWAELVPTGTNIRQIGDKLALFALAPLALIIFANGKTRWTHFAIAVAIVAFVSWSGTRAALVGIFGALLVATVFTWKVLPKLGLLYANLSVAAGMAISLLFPTPSPLYGLIRMARAVSEDEISAGRNGIWYFAIEKVGEKPWIGHGSGTFRELVQTETGYRLNHPHNFILQYLFDWGLLGGGMMLIILAWVGWTLVRMTSVAPLGRFAALAGFAGICAIGMIDGVFYYPMPIVIAILLIVPAFAEFYRHRASIASHK